MALNRKDKLKKEALEREFYNQFPTIEIINEANAPNAEMPIKFIKAFKKMLMQIRDKKNKTLNEKLVYELLKLSKKFDFDKFFRYKELIEKLFNTPVFKEHFDYYKNALCDFGKKDYINALFQIVINRIEGYLLTNTNFKNYLPFNFFSVGFLSRFRIYIKFHKIESVKSVNGTLFKHDKKIHVEGQDYNIYFTRHSIDRILERIFNHSSDDTSSNFLNNDCSNVPMKTLSEFITNAKFDFNGFSKNQHLLCCYMPMSINLASKIKDTGFENNYEIPFLDENDKSQKLLLKYFYFPFIIDGNMIICKSSLLAGFHGTPEYYLKVKILNNKADYGQFEDPKKQDLVIKTINEFYKKEEKNAVLFKEEYELLTMIFHMMGETQFVKAEWNGVPLVAETIRDV
jgi:hypothetical protein